MAPQHRECLDFGPYRLDVSERSLTRDGEGVPLTPKAAEVLYVLLDGAGRVVTKDELLEKVWPDTQVEEANVAFQIHLIRRALGDDQQPDTRRFIQTIPKRGYRFAGAVTRVPLPAAVPDTALQASTPVEPRVPPRRSWPLWAAGTSVCILAIAAVGWSWAGRTGPLRIADVRPLTHDSEQKSHDLLFTDADRLYFRNVLGSSLFSVSTSGGEVAPALPAASAFAVNDVSLARREFLALQRGDGAAAVWTLPMEFGAPRRVGGLTADGISWSSDGEYVVYTRDHQLYVARADGSEELRLPTPAGYPGCARLSPDNRRVRFVVSERNNVERSVWWEVDADGSHLHELMPHFSELPPQQTCGAWSPDGHLFVFSAAYHGRSDLWALDDSRTAKPIRLTTGPFNFTLPIFSADGARIFAVGWNPQGEAVRYDVSAHTFAPIGKRLSAIWIGYSIAGDWIVYSSFPDGALWRMRTDGTEARQLTFAPFQTDGGAWSPDGRWIAFRGRMSGEHMKTYLVPSTGGEPTPIIDGDVDQGIPTWSPDGRQLTFGDVPPVFEHPLGTEVLHVYDIARRSYSVVPGSAGLWTARWSHHGSWLAALTIVGQRLMLYDAATHVWRAMPAERIQTLNWSHDDRFIYYDTDKQPRLLRRISIADGRVEDLFDLTHYPLAASWWSGLTPDDAPILLRDLGPSQIYALDLLRNR